MGKIISFANQKGGVGKSTSAINIAAALGQMGKKTLLVDLDPQGNTTSGVGINKKQIKTSSYDVLIARADVQSAITNTAFTNLDILPSNITLAGAEFELFQHENSEYTLKGALEPIASNYDYIIIDTNPSMGVVNQNAFMAADEIILVSDVSKKAIQGAQLFSYLWEEVCENMDIADKTSALVLNNCDKRIGLTRNIMEYYQEDEDFGKMILENMIPSRVDVKNTEVRYLPINLTAPDSDACEAFRAVISELRERGVL